MSEQEHKHGEMDIQEHERMFSKFVSAMAWGGGLSLAALVFVAMVNS